MCLLPPRDTRAILNQLMKFGYIEYLSVPLSTKTATNSKAPNSGPQQMMYGVDYKKLKKIMAEKIMQTITNICVRHNELGRVS